MDLVRELPVPPYVSFSPLVAALQLVDDFARSAELQKARSEARNQAQTPGSRSSIAFASSSSSTAAPSHRSSSNSTSKSGGEKRSRWDNAASTSTNGGGRDGKRERSRSPKRR